MNRRGQLAEMDAANYLRKKKYLIVDANFTTRFGEIDLVAEKSKYVVFVEVKMRDVSSEILPREFVDYNKQKRIIAASEIYLMKNPTDLQPRFDVIEIIYKNNRIKSIKHLENAFSLL